MSLLLDTNVVNELRKRPAVIEFRSRILPVDVAVARRAARLHVPDPRPARDAYIAATATDHGLIVVTRNVSDFAALGAPCLNPWDG